MTDLESKRQIKNSQNTLLEFLPKMMVGLIIALTVLIVSWFLFVFSWSFIDFFAHPNVNTPPALSEKIRISFGVGFFVSAYAVLVFVPCTAVFGFPALLLGWRLKLIRWWTCVVGGFFLGSIPIGLILWSTNPGGSASFANGVPTLAGGIQFSTVFLISGLLGSIGGVSFWLVWQLFNYLSVPKQSR